MTAAAQADHDARILAAMEPAPAPEVAALADLRHATRGQTYTVDKGREGWRWRELLNAYDDADRALAALGVPEDAEPRVAISAALAAMKGGES